MGYARKDVEKTKKLAKKFVRYQEGAEFYSIGLTKLNIPATMSLLSGIRKPRKVCDWSNTSTTNIKLLIV